MINISKKNHYNKISVIEKLLNNNYIIRTVKTHK